MWKLRSVYCKCIFPFSEKLVYSINDGLKHITDAKDTLSTYYGLLI